MIAVLFRSNEIILARLTVLFLTQLDHRAMLRASAKTSSIFKKNDCLAMAKLSLKETNFMNYVLTGVKC